MFVCAYKRTVQGRVQISPVARYRSKRPLAPRGRASGRKYWAGGPSAGPDFTSPTKLTDARSFDYCFRGIVLLAGISLFVSQALAAIRLIEIQRKSIPHFVNAMRAGKIGTRQQSAAPGEKRQWCSSCCELAESASLSRGVTCHSEFESG
jgi:hypothetical protein